MMMMMKELVPFHLIMIFWFEMMLDHSVSLDDLKI